MSRIAVFKIFFHQGREQKCFCLRHLRRRWTLSRRKVWYQAGGRNVHQAPDNAPVTKKLHKMTWPIILPPLVKIKHFKGGNTVIDNYTVTFSQRKFLPVPDSQQLTYTLQHNLYALQFSPSQSHHKYSCCSHNCRILFSWVLLVTQTGDTYQGRFPQLNNVFNKTTIHFYQLNNFFT